MAVSEKSPKHVAQCHGVKVPDSPMITPERAARIETARYEGQEIAGALHVIRPGDRVLEIGAGIGLVGAVAAKNGKPARVISFEANPALIPHIQALYDLNRLSKVIEIRNAVLISAPDRPATMPFHIRNSYLGSSLIDTDSRATTQVDVPTAAYEDLRQELSPTVLLMDIEGGELDFLRHANLEGIRAIVVEFHPGAYGKDGMRECKNILERAGFTKLPDLSTRQVWACTRQTGLQPPLPDQGWSTKIDTLEHAIVVPAALSGFVQPAGVLTATGDYQASGALWRNGRALTEAPQMPRGDLPLRQGTWLWGGVLWAHFGHFLVESTARLWALETMGDRIDGVLFIPKRPKSGDDIRGFQRDFLSMMGCDAPMVAVTAPERIERLIVPGQGVGLGNMIAGTDAFRGAVAARFARDIAAEGPEKLYISRSGLPSGRGNLLGETALEDRLRAEGYSIYHPERHDLRSQIATYKAARQIIAAEGSALHLLAMVADPQAKVAIVVRRPSGATRNLEQQLIAFAGITPSMLVELRTSWKPKGKAKPRLWMGELDMLGLQSALARDGFIGAGGRVWDPLDRDAVRAQLGDRFEEVT